MTDYKIIKVGEDFYVAHEDFQRDAWRTDVKLGTTNFNDDKSVVEREGYFMEPYLEIGDVKFRFGPTIDDNYISINGADDVRVAWPQICHMISTLRQKESRDKRMAMDEARLQRMEHAAKTGEVTQPDGD